MYFGHPVCKRSGLLLFNCDTIFVVTNPSEYLMLSVFSKLIPQPLRPTTNADSRMHFYQVPSFLLFIRQSYGHLNLDGHEGNIRLSTSREQRLSSIVLRITSYSINLDYQSNRLTLNRGTIPPRLRHLSNCNMPTLKRKR